jgi:hypothetical protein
MTTKDIAQRLPGEHIEILNCEDRFFRKSSNPAFSACPMLPYTWSRTYGRSSPIFQAFVGHASDFDALTDAR